MPRFRIAVKNIRYTFTHPGLIPIEIVSLVGDAAAAVACWCYGWAERKCRQG